RVPSQRDGIIIAIGSEIQEAQPAPKAGQMEVRIGQEVRTFRLLREGDTVEPGQMLAQLDDRLARNELLFKRTKLVAAEADHRAAVATKTEAQARLDRMEALRKANAVSMEEYSAAVLTRDRYDQEEIAKREGIRLAQLELEHAQVILEMHTIRSPV